MAVFDESFAERLAKSHYDLDCKAHPLVSYMDFNFRLTTDEQQRSVLKLSKQAGDRHILELQHKAMRHCHQRQFCLTPLPLVSNKGEEIIELEVDGEPYFCRMLTWIEGDMMSEYVSDQHYLEVPLGSFLGRMDRALEDFSHSPFEYPFDWDLKQALRCEPLMSYITDIKVKQMVQRAFSDYRANVLPVQPELRHAYIHNDANEHNLVQGFNQAQEMYISGILDFGDLIHSTLVNNIAIAATYLLMYKEQPLHRLINLVKAYHGEMPLTETEVGLIYYLVAIRLAVSICKSSYSSHLDPENDYILISQEPAIALLEKWNSLDMTLINQKLREALNENS